MKFVFTSKGDNWDSEIDERFGRANFLIIYEENTKKIETIDNTSIAKEAHGAGNSTAQKIYNFKPDILITGNIPGDNALSALKSMNIKIFINAYDLTISEAYEKYKNGKLQEV